MCGESEGEIGEGEGGVADEVGGADMELEATLAGGDEDGREELTGLVDIGGEGFLHADGGAGTADVAGEGKELLHGNEVARLVAADAGGFLEVELHGAGDDADEIADLVAGEDEGFEDTVDVLAELGCDVDGGEVGLVDLVGNEFVGYLGGVEETGDVGFCYGFGHREND